MNTKRWEDLLERATRFREQDLSAKDFYRRIETLLESDSSLARFILGAAVTFATAVTGVASVAGALASLFERELFLSAIAILAGFITAAAKLISATPSRKAKRRIREIERDIKLVYRQAINGAGLAEQGGTS
jgi:hypothetical protein